TFNDFVQCFILQQEQLNKNVVQVIQNQAGASGSTPAKGLSVQLPIFEGKEEKTQLRNIKQTTTVQEYVARYQNLLGQVDGMHEADKILYFTEGLKPSTKAEVSYRAPEKLDDAIKLATTYNVAIYGEAEKKRRIISDVQTNTQKGEGLRITESIPMELDKVEASKYRKYKKRTFKTINDSTKAELRRKELCFWMWPKRLSGKKLP
ncbi:13719_t:CDS:2, partial [Racocetra fulgida]